MDPVIFSNDVTRTGALLLRPWFAKVIVSVTAFTATVLLVVCIIPKPVTVMPTSSPAVFAMATTDEPSVSVAAFDTVVCKPTFAEITTEFPATAVPNLENIECSAVLDNLQLV